MKLIIDIPEETYNNIQSRDWKNGKLVFSEEWKAIHNGTPLDGVLQEIWQEIDNIDEVALFKETILEILDKHIKEYTDEM